jgi:hypothetical protein
MRPIRLIPLLLLCWTLGLQWTAFADEADETAAEKGSEFIRVLRDDDKQPLYLETATVRYVFGEGDDQLIVDLIGVIHVADKPYYAAFNEQFKQYEAVLYEMVKPEDVEVTERVGKPSNNPIGMIQSMLPDMLDLHSQLDGVDYGADNFVHADLSPAQMSEAMRKRGDNGTTVFLKIALEVMGQAMRQSSAVGQEGGTAPSEIDLFSMLVNPNGSVSMKKLMAEQFANMGEGAPLGHTLETILIDDRNSAAMNVLAEQINGGTKKMAIFYGAAHMPDFEQRLKALGFTPSETTWQRAWDMSTDPEAEADESPLGGFLKLFSR